MKVLSLLLRNGLHDRSVEKRASLNESPELIAQEYAENREGEFDSAGLNESPELIAQESRAKCQSGQHERASMKVLSLLLRNGSRWFPYMPIEALPQ